MDVFEDLKRRIAAAEEFLDSKRLIVGIPEANCAAEGNGMTNVALAFLQSQGSPVNRIPPRPFLEPAIEQKQTLDRVCDYMREAADAALQEDFAYSLGCMNRAGTIAENAVKDYFGSSDLAPNAPFTINGGWMRNRVSGKPFHANGKGSSAPLIDSGALRSSITHVVEERGK